MNLNRRGTTVTVALALITVLSGCDETGSSRPGSAPAAKSSSAAPHFDPPVGFAPDGRPLTFSQTPEEPKGANNMIVSGRTAYFQSDGGLHAVDLPSGELSWTARPGSGGEVSGGGIQPLLATMGGRPYLVGLFDVTIPGQGTTPAKKVVEVLAADPATGRVVRDDTLPLPVRPAQGDDDAEQFTQQWLVGADDKAIVIMLNGTEGDVTLVEDPAAHRIRWFERDMTAFAVADGQVIAGTGRDINNLMRSGYYTLHSIDTVTKVERWRTKEIYTGSYKGQPAGPGLVAINSGDDTEGLVDAATGKTRFSWPDHKVNYDCVYDERSVTVCTTTGTVMAFDTATAKLLWRLPTDGRIAPTVTTAWHGAVYGTTPNGPVVIDARSGQDRGTSPGAAPSLVGPYGGIVNEDDQPPAFHPAAA
ncbi:PQQ-binding-like beta-propeller repeat protein [Actinoallomurus iriomotensis]|uniref:outer membrane protein assembly factor BamB family protein n=1 Tax=Actinoallomurus iriomotensis TaxID=478107 RepID=UPI00255657C7|nr:PQQ-binding-like beta-propeller repeat protein [Actinoallomurus iriomotensis]